MSEKEDEGKCGWNSGDGATLVEHPGPPPRMVVGMDLGIAKPPETGIAVYETRGFPEVPRLLFVGHALDTEVAARLMIRALTSHAEIITRQIRNAYEHMIVPRIPRITMPMAEQPLPVSIAIELHKIIGRCEVKSERRKRGRIIRRLQKQL